MRDSKKTSFDQIHKGGTDKEILDNLLKETFAYFLKQTDPVTGLVADKSQPGSPCSIAVAGMGLTAYIAGIENRLIPKHDAILNILKMLRFFYYSPQGKETDATGYKGFYYHFLDMKTGRRAWNCEISTIDTALFIAGVLSVVSYFSADNPEENEIRKIGNDLYTRIDWTWALNKRTTLTHGWKPESGFIPYRWNKFYNEAIILYVLAMGSPTYPIGAKGYKKWTSTFELIKRYNLEYIYAGPLFIHQFTHLWIDFRGIMDEVNKKNGFDYFENSRRATCIHREYARENPKGFRKYSEYFWGLSASDGPGPQTLTIEGKKRKFYGYLSRGAPFGPDDGTVSPWSVVASLPFAPEIVLETIGYIIKHLDVKESRIYGCETSFNPTHPEKDKNPEGWISPWQFGLNNGAIIIMIQNYFSGLIWDTMKKCTPIVNGLKSGGFSGGWLENLPE